MKTPSYIWSVVDRDMLDDEHQKNFTQPWLCVAPDNTVLEFSTENEACAYQVQQGREE